MAPESLDYRTLVQDALRSVVIRSLRVVRDQGLPGEHHFYITFATEYPEVGLSDSLRDRYPEEMTIVLQHDYRDLEVDDDGFAVTMRFGGVPQRLYVPLAAVLSFYDPSVEFLLQFRPDEDAEGGQDDQALESDAVEPASARSESDRFTGDRSSDTESSEDNSSEDNFAESDASESGASESGASENNVVSIDAFRRK